MKKKTIKWILGVIGIILLTLLGNALWVLIEPAWDWFLNITFKITTLGLASRSDAFYQRVAKGLHEEPSLEVLSLIILIICFYCGGEIGKIFVEYDVFSSKKKKKKLEGMDEKEYSEYLEKLKRKIRRHDYIKVIILIAVVIFLTLRLSTFANRNNAVSHFRRVFTAAKYAMNNEEEELILLEFSAIKNKQDYSNVIKKLQEKLARKQQELEKEGQRLEVEHQKAKKRIEDLTSSSVKDKTK